MTATDPLRSFNCLAFDKTILDFVWNQKKHMRNFRREWIAPEKRTLPRLTGQQYLG